MNRFLITVACAAVWIGGCGAAPKEEKPATPPAADAGIKALPAPDTKGGLPLNEVLASRRSVRAYAERKLTAAELGQLLWAGQGITSPEGKRTAPSAVATYPLRLYVFDDEGTWRYEPKSHALSKIADDKRAELAVAAPQKHVARAPAAIVIVADLNVTEPKFGKEKAERFAALEAGHVAQNIVLEATALGLGAVTMAGFDEAALVRILGLGANNIPMYLIPVGARAETK